MAVAELLRPPGGVKDLDLALCRNVHTRGALVHDQRLRVAQDGECEAKQLPLADAKVATVADIAFEATRSAYTEVLFLKHNTCYLTSNTIAVVQHY